MVTHLGAVTITVTLALVLMVNLTSILLKECLHRAIRVRYSLSFLYYTIHRPVATLFTQIMYVHVYSICLHVLHDIVCTVKRILQAPLHMLLVQ